MCERRDLINRRPEPSVALLHCYPVHTHKVSLILSSVATANRSSAASGRQGASSLRTGAMLSAGKRPDRDAPSPYQSSGAGESRHASMRVRRSFGRGSRRSSVGLRSSRYGKYSRHRSPERSSRNVFSHPLPVVFSSLRLLTNSWAEVVQKNMS